MELDRGSTAMTTLVGALSNRERASRTIIVAGICVVFCVLRVMIFAQFIMIDLYVNV